MNIGKEITTKKDVNIDLEKLLKTRCLTMASSGAGKSWTLRRILEQTHGQVKQIVFDAEGEFTSLKPTFDYLIIGKNQDLEINVENAEEHAQLSLEEDKSVIVDLSDLKINERQVYVQKFLDTLLDAPQGLWQPILVALDEVHRLCPQDKKVPSKDSVIRLMDSGRKRGYGVVLSTQRAAKLDKDAAAEAQNKIIGRFGLDIDRKRAANELGFSSKEDEYSLSKLKDGVFYCVGPAISDTVQKVKVGGVQTKHPEPPMKKRAPRKKNKIVPKKYSKNKEKVKFLLGGLLLTLAGMITESILVVPGILLFFWALIKIFSD